MSSLSNLNSLPTQAKAHVREQAFSSQHKLQKAHFEVIVFLRTLWSSHQLTYSSRNCVRSKKIIIHRYQHKDTNLYEWADFLRPYQQGCLQWDAWDTNMHPLQLAVQSLTMTLSLLPEPPQRAQLLATSHCQNQLEKKYLQHNTY